MTLPVYLVHYDAPDWIRASVNAALSSDIPVAVTVLNNGPQKSLPVDARVVNLECNRGYAGAANYGLREWLSGMAPFCVVGSHDLLFRPDTLRRLVEAAEASSDFGMIGPELTKNWLPQILEPTPLIDERRVISGGCVLFRRQCVNAAGLFDEDFGSYAEDEDLSLRSRAAGWRVGTVRGLRVETFGTRNPALATRLKTTNAILLRYKHGGKTDAIRSCLAALMKALRAVLRLRLWTAGQHVLGIMVGFGKVTRRLGQRA